MKKFLATLALLASLSILTLGPDARAQSLSLFDVQFEADGTTYMLNNQSFPLELSVDEWGFGSFADIFWGLYPTASFSSFVDSSEWLSQTGDEASLVQNPDGGFTLTISRPFIGTIEMNGQYEYMGSTHEWDPDLNDWVDTDVTWTNDYCITISVPGFESEPAVTAIVASSGDVGKVIGANGKLYSDVTDAGMAGTTAEAMVAWLDMSTRTGLAIALADVGGDLPMIRNAANLIDTGWAPNHPVALADWRLPTLADWRLIFAGCGGASTNSALTADTAYDIGSIQAMLSSVGGTAFSLVDNLYASSTMEGPQYWCFDFFNGFFCTSNLRTKANVRACLAFDFVTPYDAWAATNSLGEADVVTDGVPNLIRYVFDRPSGACNPFAGISFVNGKPVVKTLAPVHTEGASITLVSSTNLTDWAQAVELSPDVDPNGELVFEHNTNDPVRFYRFKVEEQ